RVQCNSIYLCKWIGKHVAFIAVRPGAAIAMSHPGKQKQSGKFLCAAESLRSLSVILPAFAGLAGNQSFVIRNGVQRRRPRIGEAVREDQLAAVRLEFFEVGCVGVEPRGELLVDRVHVMVEIKGQKVEIVTQRPLQGGLLPQRRKSRRETGVRL